MNGLPQPAYVMSKPHLSGYRVIIGYETLSEAQDAQAALCQPQAREDAQPVWGYAYRQAEFGGVTITPKPEWRLWPMTTDIDRRCIEDMRSQGSRYDLQPLYTHPAPDALRVAVEALEEVASLFDEESYPRNGSIERRDGDKARQALAALQAEHGAK